MLLLPVKTPLAPTASAHDPDFLLLASSYCAAALNRPPSISLDNVSGRSTPEGIIKDITTTNWELTVDESDLNQSYHPMMMDEKFIRLRQTVMGIDTTNQSVNRIIQNRLEQLKEAEKRKAAQAYNERVGDIERNHRLILDELRQQRLSHAFRHHTQEHPRITNEPTPQMCVSIQTPYELSTNLAAMEGSSTTNTNTNLTTRASFCKDGTSRVQGDTGEPSGALVLMDSSPDVTLSNIGATFNPDIHLHFLTNKKIHCELKRKQEQLQKLQDDHLPQLWMYFDSGASRSVISPTSPIRSHLTQIRPVEGSCSIGDGTPLEYIEKGLFNNTLDNSGQEPEI